MFLNKSHIKQFWNFFSLVVAKYPASLRLGLRNSRKRLDKFLKDLGAAQLDNLQDGLWVRPRDLGNFWAQFGPRQEAAVSYDGL